MLQDLRYLQDLSGDDSDNSSVDPVTRKRQTTSLTKFMIRQFFKGIKKQYSDVFLHDLNVDTLSKFLEILMRRVRTNKTQFKRACIITIKFLEFCLADTQKKLMEFLNYDLKKLLISSFVLSVTEDDFTNIADNVVMKRNDTYKLFAKATGLSISEINNCCCIVRPVLIKESRHQYTLIRKTFVNQQQSSSCGNESARIARNNLLNYSSSLFTDINKNANYQLTSLDPIFSNSRPRSSKKLGSSTFENFSLDDLKIKIDDKEDILDTNRFDTMRSELKKSSKDNSLHMDPKLLQINPSGNSLVTDSDNDENENNIHFMTKHIVLQTELDRFNELGKKLVSSTFVAA